ncbi:probable Molybdenum cofactor sulfurase [Rhynchosporium agropyri]|uniref:Molybdenum cofactor sulfurase n=1 Tax=Rhynchosporium agropyri TaxID=914238 RepID=A0A1E1K9A1_9HELO|nr:probable Molybdenum cofactor sulfurase [Rhynchosporium agropyri]
MAHGYNQDVEDFREEEYPMLKDAIYLDHAGTTIYPKSLMERFMCDMMSNLYGNPHSASPSSQLSTNRIEDIRLKVLHFFNADPSMFDLVFTANATAGIKLVMDAFRDVEHGFNYGYHRDAHTSLVGVREIARASQCLDDGDVENWLLGAGSLVEGGPQLAVEIFAYPAQSNMDGRRLPLSWIPRARNSSMVSPAYTILDASAYVSTAQLNLSNADTAPDFTVLSFYKIFGFPDLGGLIVRKESGDILKERKYFGGGTVDVVVCGKEQWHASKGDSFHERLEDGSLPVHSILALDAAIDVHKKLYGSMERIAQHTAFLAQRLYNGLVSLRHANSEPVCQIYSQGFASEMPISSQGPIVAFNLRNSKGAWISNTEFEKLAVVRKFHVRSGGLCNPGGVAACLNLEPWEMRKNFSAGFRCGAETDIYCGKITGVIRASMGAMTTQGDVDAFVAFIREFYVENLTFPLVALSNIEESAQLVVESLTIYPIKSCGGFAVPLNTDWEIRPEGLAWDREWCLVQQGTGQALSQKRHPRMALIRPAIDFDRGVLRVRCVGSSEEITVPLSSIPVCFETDSGTQPTRVCGDAIVTRKYASSKVNEFFSEVLDVPCALARFPAGGSGFSTRHAKAHLQKHQISIADAPKVTLVAGTQAPPTPPDSDSEVPRRPILLSNESPILVIARSSLDALNKQITKVGGKPASASVFRANVVLASSESKIMEPYGEDHWTSLRIGKQTFQMLGSCRRCHMICIDQETAEKNDQPFLTLAKTRRFDSKIFFGSHMCHVPSENLTTTSQFPSIRAGDPVKVSVEDSL